jgi:hypothetical protein
MGTTGIALEFSWTDEKPLTLVLMIILLKNFKNLALEALL